MKSAVFLLALVAIASAKSLQGDDLDINPVYGYLTKYGIPEAERIRKAEEEILKNKSSRIVGGSPSAIGQFKYQVGLLSDIIGITTGNGVCGGSLLSANRVLTAAHCWFDGVNQAWRLTVILGSTFLFTGGTRIQTDDIVMHPLWIPLIIRNDIAMIRLPTNVAFSDTIAPIALPNGALSTETFEDEIGTASGFGLTVSHGNITQGQYLSHVKMPIISNDICSVIIPWIFQPSNLCTRTLGGLSTCQGDSGGPLTVERNGEPVLVGVTSFGIIFGCHLGWPATFARVTSFLNFINVLL